MPMTAPGTPVAAGAFAISSKPRGPTGPVPHDAAGGAEGHPERADLCSIRQWHPSSERSKYSAFGAGLYTSYLEGLTIAVTGSVCRSVHNHTDTQWLFGNSG